MKMIKYVIFSAFHKIGLCSFILYRNHFTDRTDCAIPERFISTCTLKRNKCFGKGFSLSYKEPQLQYGRRNGHFNIYRSITHLNVQLYIHCLSKDHQISSFWVIFLSSVVKQYYQRGYYIQLFMCTLLVRIKTCLKFARLNCSRASKEKFSRAES